MNILFIQFGDYRDAFINLNSGGSETYKAQKQSVDFVADLKQVHGHHVCVICVNSASDYDDNLPNGIRVVGFNKKNVNREAIYGVIDSFSTTHIVLRTPLAYVLEYCLKNSVKVLPVFADYFSNKGLLTWYKNKRLTQLLNNPAIPLVSNHNYPACDSLARLGVAKEKIVPWDWAATTTPDSFPDKKLDSKSIRLLYVGAVAKDKGSFDCIAAMAHLLEDKNHDYTLKIIGSGDLETAKALASQLSSPERVSILGSISNTQVLQEMANATIVIVPSRHEYPEGMPNTVYEGLITKTPLIVSDHPVFTERFKDLDEVIFFKASQPNSLAEKITYLITHPLQYQALSNNSKALWLKLQMPLKWDELITAWLAGISAQSEILSKFALSVVKR